MRRYWDLTEQQRAAIAEDEVRSLLAVELMENGIPALPVLQLRSVPDLVVPTKAVARIRHNTRDSYGSAQDLQIAFETMEQAQAFLALKPLCIEQDYEARTPYYASLRDASLFTAEVPPFEETKKIALALREKRAAEDFNAKAVRDHEEAVRASEKATTHVWEDWHKCRSLADSLRRVLDTRTEYVRLAGDEMIAESFLLKAFTAEKIAEAKEWATTGALPRSDTINLGQTPSSDIPF